MKGELLGNKMRLCFVIRNMKINMRSLARCLLVSAAHCKEDPIYVFPEMKLRGLVPNFHIHVSNLYISKADGSWVYINRSQIHEYRNWERGRAVSFLGIIVSNF
jgi:hypothetical protein